ncbi:MAG: M28 family peptidase [Coriobacteriia bacterium]|nr:M28 family peptidase [Coriobacteriia bacterium]
MSDSSIESDTRALALPDGRLVGSEGHDVARDHVVARMGEIGLTPFAGESFELPFSRHCGGLLGQVDFTNIVGVVPGADRGKPPLLVGAHYDSVIPAPCADDNATAVAVCLAVAEELVAVPLDRDVIIAIFDSEEPPFFLSDCMGSTRFVTDHCRGLDFRCAVIMDLIGHAVRFAAPGIDTAFPDLANLVFATGAESAGHLPAALERASARSTLPVFATLNRYGGGDLSDHHVFRRAGQPYLFLTCERGGHYHSCSDTCDWIDFEKVKKVNGLVLELLRAADDETLAPYPAAIDGDSTAAFEAHMIAAAMGGAHLALLDRMRLTSLSSRQDIDRFVEGLQRLL